MAELSIVTGHWNRHESMKRLVLSIAKHTKMDWELVVADCSDTPFEASKIGGKQAKEVGTTPYDLSKRVRIIRDWPKTTMVAGYNKAFAACGGTWVVWLNDDAEVTENWDTEAVQYMQAHPEIGLGAMYYTDGGSAWFVQEYCGATYANFGIIRKEIGDRVRWFDSDLSMYGCDNSLTFKVLLLGMGCVGIPKARVIHHAPPDAQRIGNVRTQQADKAILDAKYGAHLDKARATYERFKHLDGPRRIQK